LVDSLETRAVTDHLIRSRNTQQLVGRIRWSTTRSNGAPIERADDLGSRDGADTVEDRCPLGRTCKEPTCKLLPVLIVALLAGCGGEAPTDTTLTVAPPAPPVNSQSPHEDAP
jgi:hypothetical protein